MRPSRTSSNPGATGDVELATLAKALGHPARVAILKLLLTRGQCVCGAIVDELPLAQATVSQHLKVLKAAGLVQGEIDGPRVCYCVNAAAIRRIQDLVGGLSGACCSPSRASSPGKGCTP